MKVRLKEMILVTVVGFSAHAENQFSKECEANKGLIKTVTLTDVVLKESGENKTIWLKDVQLTEKEDDPVSSFKETAMDIRCGLTDELTDLKKITASGDKVVKSVDCQMNSFTLEFNTVRGNLKFYCEPGPYSYMPRKMNGWGYMDIHFKNFKEALEKKGIKLNGQLKTDFKETPKELIVLYNSTQNSEKRAEIRAKLYMLNKNNNQPIQKAEVPAKGLN